MHPSLRPLQHALRGSAWFSPSALGPDLAHPRQHQCSCRIRCKKTLQRRSERCVERSRVLWGRVNNVGVDTATGSTATRSTAGHGDGHRMATGTGRPWARSSHGHGAAAGTGRTRVRDGHSTGIARARHGYGHGHDHSGVRTIL